MKILQLLILTVLILQFAGAVDQNLTEKVMELEERLANVEQNCTPKLLQPVYNTTVYQQPQWIDWKIGTGLLAFTCIVVTIACFWFIFVWGRKTGLWKELQETTEEKK